MTLSKMIDKNTGEIVTNDGTRIGSKTSRETFLSSPIGHESRVSVVNEPWCSYRLPLIRMDGRDFGAIIFFCGTYVESISLSISDENLGSSWVNWSDVNEQKNDELNQIWLREVIGEDHKFPWGTIWAGRDPKTTDASIVIRYRNDT